MTTNVGTVDRANWLVMGVAFNGGQDFFDVAFVKDATVIFRLV